MTTSSRWLHPRDELLETMQRIYRFRMTTTSGGNLSLRDAAGNIWITPSRVDKGGLRRTDIVCVRADGSVDGPHPPSSEYPFHKAIYAARPDLRGIVHAHPVALVAFSMVRQVPNTRLFHQARKTCGPVGLAPYACPGSAALGENIATVFKGGFDCVVLENHGVVVGGTSFAESFRRFETLEFTAKTILKAVRLGDIQYLGDEQIALPAVAIPALPEFPRRPVATDLTETETTERELRRQLVEFVRRAYQQRLVISTEGSFSARVDENSFLITPQQFDRANLELTDLVLIQNGSREAGQNPSRAARNHAAIYAQHADVMSIANADPVNATAFSVTAADFNSRTIPESYLLLRDVQRIPYGMQFHDPGALASQLSMQSPIAILENDGVMVCGNSVLDAFDRLEVLETTAEAIINAQSLGDVMPMSDEVIRELRAAFFGEAADDATA